jgi:nucleolar MIF4G domain-containing protein 1
VTKPEVESEEDEDEDASSGEESTVQTRPAPSTAKKPGKSILKKIEPKESSPPLPTVSRAVKDRLAQDDAEIAALEKRLGVKGKKKSKNLDDGLEDIFGDLGDLDSDEEDLFASKTSKRKRDTDDEWLASKRQRALAKSTGNTKAAQEDSDTEGDEGLEGLESGEELDLEDDEEQEEDVGDFDTDEEEEEMEEEKPRVRENPYIAPVAPGTLPAKYIPPALRAPPSSDAEALSRLRRQIQGLLNRLSDANMLTILRDVEKIYQNNPRGYVTTTLIDLLIGLLADPTTLIDTFLILHAGFIAAVYKVVGPDFGAQMVERIVSEFDGNYQRNKDGIGKHTTNLMTVVADLYCLQVIGSKLVFEYLRQFLSELSEINTELLLRIVRVSGPQLRQDDPSSLKDIVLLLQKSVAKVGEKNLSVRTKFMIETINDLKNNKMKTGVAASALVSEHTVRMKKQLGTLNTRNLKGTEPLRIGLTDIRDTEKKGKWWLVGASWRNDPTTEAEESFEHQQTKAADPDLAEENGEVDLFQLAREQRMNTDVRRAIFISIMSASDYKDAHMRLLKLNLKKSQEMEIPRVIVHCAGCEDTYNPYYTLLAQKFCSDHKSRKCFQFALWDIFKSLGENKDDDEDSDDEDEDNDEESKNDLSLRRLVNLGKLYGTLIAKDGLSITSLKPLNFPYIKPKTQRLVEIMLVTTMLESQKKTKEKTSRDEKALLSIFINVDAAPEMVAGLQFFMKRVISKTAITANKKEKEMVKWGCRCVLDMLERLMATTAMEDD